MNLDIVNNKKFSFADGHIFKTINGEGAMIGVTNIFFRLAGCSVACKGCDTRYNHYKIEMNINEIIEKLLIDENKNVEWIWITGGEPTDQDLGFLVEQIKKNLPEKKIALATSGVKDVSKIPFDFISVSPHGNPNQLRVYKSNQINLVPSLGGLRLADWIGYDFFDYQHKFITPLHSDDKSFMNDSLNECLEWIDSNPSFRLGIQAHKIWGIK